MDKIFNRINLITIIYLVLLIPLFFLDKALDAYFTYDLIKYEYHQLLWYLIPVLIVIYLYNLIRKKTKIGKLDLLVFLMIILNIIVSYNAIDKDISIWGTSFRHEGFVTLSTYYLIFLNSKCLLKRKWINFIIYLFIGIGIFQFIFCFMQMYFKDLLHLELVYKTNSNMASGFIGNPNFMGSYIILLLGFVVVKYLTNEKYWIWYLLLTIIFFVNLLFTQSTGPFLGFIVMVLFILIFLIIKKKLKIIRYIILIISLIGSYFTIDYSMSINKDINSNIKDKSYTISYDLKQLYRALKGELQVDETVQDEGIVDYRYSEIPKEDNFDGLGSGRIMIWKNALKLVPDYFYLGCGIDNFGNAYKWHSVVYYDKAHNDYLQILVTRGIFSLIVYLAFLLILFIRGVRSKEPLTWALLLSVVGYAAQMFTNISVIKVAPYFFLVCGLLAALEEKEKSKSKLTSN